VTRRASQFLFGLILVFGTFWNISVFTVETLKNLTPREADELSIQENRFKPIRERLISLTYSGKLEFVTTQDLRSEATKPEDGLRWSQAQYVMLPWVLVRKSQTVGGIEVHGADLPFVIGDFPIDKPLPNFPPYLSKLFDTGNGLILFKRNTVP